LLYEAAADRGMTPLEVDAMELWQLASALGANRPPESKKSIDPADRVKARREWNAERIAALERGERQPEHARPDASGLADLQTLVEAYGAG
jgi:hypothetical protein